MMEDIVLLIKVIFVCGIIAIVFWVIALFIIVPIFIIILKSMIYVTDYVNDFLNSKKR